MAASMIKLYTQFTPLKQLFIPVWYELSTQHQHYHTTSVYYKKAIKLTNENIENYVFNAKNTKKRAPTIEVWKNITIKELATSCKRNTNDIIDVLYIMGWSNNCTPNTVLNDVHLVTSIVKKLGGVPKRINLTQNSPKEEKYENIIRSPPPDESVLVKRHPIVTIMGHVDHGKTTLLDSLRNTSVVNTEFGGITQHIGAFDVKLKSGDRVTFLDTPGHAAFSAMRYRGAHVTDIVVLVVAADDGVKEQTLQSIQMAKDAGVPVIVAINKIDKANADIKRTQLMLAENNIVVEDLGGDVQCVNISALKGTNLENLTEAIVLQAELMDLKGDPVGLVEGVAIECTNNIGRGMLVTALIKRGTLKKGCLLVSGMAWAKVRAMFNENGTLVSEAKPSEAVQIIGWKALPPVGGEILQAVNERELKLALKFRQTQYNTNLSKVHEEGASKKYEDHLKEYKRYIAIRTEVGKMHPTVREMKQDLQRKQWNEVEKDLKVNCIIKGDVSGSVEAILNTFDAYSEDNQCKLNVVHYGVGAVTKTDLELANVFNAIIYRFNVDLPHSIKEEADKKKIDIRQHNVIYKLVDNLKEEIHNRLPIVDIEEIIGEATVLQQFEINEKNKKVKVAGCRCTKGVLKSSEMYHLIRDNETVYKGKLVSMRHLKDEVSKIEMNVECGLRFDDPTVSFQPGDTIVCVTLQKKRPKVMWDIGF
ncbi:mitochondrial translation initiation factor 2 isoform X2 [Nomia melanderi]|uniref:mitochondrial translation initiation factor 2 isoform X2 n=1 Tax=Nomia melanderi TaxID=2448451 RepID=UPI001304139C|nr:translation initiation factor IF-2, mitochondrial isoform X2 [Nomia melanderi]